MNILQINASARRATDAEGSVSTRLANELTAGLRAASPAATVTVRDLNVTPQPVLDEAALGALFTPAGQRTPEQAARVALDDALIAELQAADTVVIGVPMYNFNVTAQFKNWIDAVARAGVTFKYTETGPVGLAGGKKVYVVSARGGVYSNEQGQQMDFQEDYLKTVLGFLGITDVSFVRAEGVAMGPDAKAAALAAAEAAIAAA